MLHALLRQEEMEHATQEINVDHWVERLLELVLPGLEFVVLVCEFEDIIFKLITFRN